MLQALAGQVYKQRIAAGVAREQARKDLPLSTYTEAYWKIDLHNLFNFLRLRMDGHAQAEIREYANALGEFVRRQTPLCWEAFNDYQLRAVTVSGPEIVALNHMHLGFERACELAGLKGSEARDFAEKRTRLGFHQLSEAPTALCA